MERAKPATRRFNVIASVHAAALKQQTNIVYLYLLATLLLFADRWWNGMLLSQLQPSFFITPMNVSAWALMFTGIHKVFINSQAACLIADVVLIGLPILYVLLHIKQHIRSKIFVGYCLLLYNFIYAQCYVLYPSNSIEGHIGWILFPLVLVCRNLVSFSLALQAIRFVFLFFFVSAGVWKLRNGGIFYPGQMSGVLLLQHAQMLVTAPDSILTEIFYWLIHRPAIGYLLYLAATLLELFFIVGFFTRKMDRWLVGLFLVFLVSDMLVMRIKYWEILHLALPLLFSNKAVMKAEESAE